MLYRISGALFFIFGALQLYGRLSGGDQPRSGETGFASGQYGGLITGITLTVAGLYLLIKCRTERT